MAAQSGGGLLSAAHMLALPCLVSLSCFMDACVPLAYAYLHCSTRVCLHHQVCLLAHQLVSATQGGSYLPCHMPSYVI